MPDRILHRLSLSLACLLLVATGALANGFHATVDPDAGTSTQQAVPWSEAELNDLRRLYITSPDLFAEYVSRRLHGNTESFRLGRRLSTDEAFGQVEQAVSDMGEEFLEGSPVVDQMLDSLRLDFFEHPRSFSAGQLEHLSRVSRRANRVPFLRGNPGLEELLLTESEEFFKDPDAFSDRRIEELNGIAMNVSALPFLRGNPLLTSQVHRARLEFENDRGSFTQKRLAELELISLRVMNEPFRPKSSAILAIVIIGVGLVIASFVLIRIRSEPSNGGFRQPVLVSTDDKTMTFPMALAVLGLEPDFTDEQLASAYRSLQKRYHPDRVAHLGDEFRLIAESKVRRINDAYDLLSKRATRGESRKRSSASESSAA